MISEYDYEQYYLAPITFIYDSQSHSHFFYDPFIFMFEFNFRIFSTASYVTNDLNMSVIFIFFKYEYEKKCEKNVKTRDRRFHHGAE